MVIENDAKLVFIGDSITDCGREGDGEGLHDVSWGNGYVLLIKSALQAFYNDKKIRVVNKGISGNTVRDLKTRWECDVLDQKADWLSVMIGINDVWRHFDCPLITDSQVGLKEYTDTYRELLNTVNGNVKGLIICSPYVIDTNPADSMRVMMDQYRAAAEELAEEFNAIYVDMQLLYDTFLVSNHPNCLCWDRIHPNMTGHMMMAKQWLSAVGASL